MPLEDKDFYAIVNDYGELLEKVVIEMTEQTEISEDDLDRINGCVLKRTI